MRQVTVDDESAELSFDSFGAQSPAGDAVKAASKLIQDTIKTGTPDETVLEEVIAGVFVGLRTDPAFELAWFFPKAAADYRPLHALNAARLAMHFGLCSGMDDSRVVQLGIIGLFYDIGMSIPGLPDVLAPKDLSREELSQVETAPMRGAELLKGAKSLDPLCAIVSAQHHERADGTGYPNRSPADKQHPYSRLFQLIDSYLGMIEPRSFRKAISPAEAMQRLVVQAHRGYFHEPTFRDWLKVIGLHPVGSFVKLNTGELAIVHRANPERPRAPVVKVLADELLDFRLRPMELDISSDPAFAIEAPFTQFPKSK